MLALSIKQPWAVLIVERIKPIEIRTWPAPLKLIGKRIYIHAGKNPANAPDHIQEMSEKYTQWLGYLLGTALFKEVVKYNTEAEFVADEGLHYNTPEMFLEGCFGFVFDEIEKFERPIRYKGQLGFFEVRTANENPTET